MEARAKVLQVKLSPQKAKLVVDLVRGKSVQDALDLLKFTNKSASPVVIKLIKSAAANATNNFKMDESKYTLKKFGLAKAQDLKDLCLKQKVALQELLKELATSMLW